MRVTKAMAGVPALMLTGERAEICGAGQDELTLGYRPGEDGYALKVRTQVRTGWRPDASGHPMSIGTTLSDAGVTALMELFLPTVTRELARDHERFDQRLASVRELGARLPGRPWTFRPAFVDRRPFVLFTTPLDDVPGFAAVIDVGPTVVALAGTGTLADWTWRFTTATPERLGKLKW